MKFIIFDLDDTLLCGDCEAGWINFLVIKGLLSGDEHSSKLNQFDSDYRKGILNFDEYSSYIQAPLKNLDITTVENLVDEFIKKNIDDLTDDLTTDLLKEAKSADKVLIASGSHDFLVKGFAEYFGIEFSIGTPVEIKKDIFTGSLSGEPTFSEGKVKAVKNWCSENNLKIEDSIF
jgi:Phosphoserine phosphatase